MNKDNGDSRKGLRLAALLAAFTLCSLVSCGKTEITEETSRYSTQFYETAPFGGAQTTMEAPMSDTTAFFTAETTAFTTNNENRATTTFADVETVNATSSVTVAETTSETTTVPNVSTTSSVNTEPREYTVKTTYSDSIPYETEYFYSDELYEGEQRILKRGANGKQLTTVYSTYRDGALAYIVSEKRTVTAPVNEEIMVGTAPIVSSAIETESVDTPFSTRYVFDGDMYEDEQEVISEGEPGKETTFYEVTYRYGSVVKREAVGVNIIPPTDRVIKKGTKPVLSSQTVVRKENVAAFSVEYIYDANMYEGERTTATEGREGYETNTYLVTFIKGIKAKEELISSVKTEAINTVIKLGTRKKEEEMRMPFYTAAEGGADYYVSQHFGGENDHGGIDFGVYYGSPILAVMSGTVVYAYNDGYFPKSNALWTYGTYVVIEHENGMRTYYAHLSSRKVSVGDKVKRGQVIGYSGNTGRVLPSPTQANPYAGTHLHFEVRVLSYGVYKKVDPRGYLPRWK